MDWPGVGPGWGRRYRLNLIYGDPRNNLIWQVCTPVQADWRLDELIDDYWRKIMAHTLRHALVPFLFMVAGTAVAGPAADHAQTHFRAIAGGQIENLVGQYADSATLEWVGGPLDGRYAGKAALGEVWGKFAKAQGELQFKVSDLRESANPKGGTVTANVIFSGKSDIKVRYVLTYRDGKIVSEVWQIDPNLAG